MNKIDWTKWSAIAEILSAVAIVVTLLYLALQTRYLAVQTEQNSQAIRAASTQGVVESESNALSAITEFPEIYAAITNADFSGDDAVRLNAFWARLVRAHENYWRLHQLGAIDESTLQAYQQSLAYILSYERTRNWWHRLTPAFDPAFVDQVNTLLENFGLVPGEMPENIKRLFENSQ